MPVSRTGTGDVLVALCPESQLVASLCSGSGRSVDKKQTLTSPRALGPSLLPEGQGHPQVPLLKH